MSAKIQQQLGSLNNKNKREVGKSYQMQRFGVGDLLKLPSGVVVEVSHRQPGSTFVLERHKNVEENRETEILWDATTYEYVKAAPPR